MANKSSIDQDITFSHISGLADLVDKIPEELTEIFDRFFNGDKDLSYYLGMLAAYYHCFKTIKNEELEDPPEDLIRFMMIYIAGRLIEDGKIQRYIH